MPTERCDAAQNRRRILEVAKDLLTEGKLGDTSMQEIARAAKVGQGTLYRRFADKGELCEALFADDLEVFREAADAYLREHALDRSALARLKWLLAAKIRFVDAHLPLFLASHEVAGSKRYDNFKKSHHLWNVERVTELLNEAQAHGEADIHDVAFATDAILASFSAPLLAYQRRALGYSLGRVIAGVTEVFIRGLQRSARSGSPKPSELTADQPTNRPPLERPAAILSPESGPASRVEKRLDRPVPTELG